MPIAGAVVTAINKESEKDLSERLAALEDASVEDTGVVGVTVEGVGEKGIALVLEADSVDSLHELSEAISRWDEVVDFQLAYLNWEDTVETQ